MTESTILRKSISLEDLIPALTQVEDINSWRNLNQDSTISDHPFSGFQNFPEINRTTLNEYALQLREEGYFQTNPLIPIATLLG